MRIWSGHRGFAAGGPRALGDREGRDTEAVLKHKPAAALERDNEQAEADEGAEDRRDYGPPRGGSPDEGDRQPEGGEDDKEPGCAVGPQKMGRDVWFCFGDDKHIAGCT